MKRLLYILAVVLLVSSCDILKRVPQKEIQHDTLTVYKNNTVYERDSIYFWRDRLVYTKGDTVYSETTVYKDRWKEKAVHDTLYVDRSVVNDIENPVYVEKELTKVQKLLLSLGKIFSILLLGALGYGGFKLYKKLF